MGDSVLKNAENGRLKGLGKRSLLRAVAVGVLLFFSFGILIFGITPLLSDASRQVDGADGSTVVIDRPVDGILPFDGSNACIAEGEISVSANAAFLCTAGGQVLYAKQPLSRLPMASITKIMTALVVIEQVSDLQRTIKVSPLAVGVEGSSAYLRANDTVTVSDLLYALLLASANDAAIALAVDVAGSVDGFVSMMNRKAHDLGLVDTSFANPHGLSDSSHYTTARDYAMLMSYAISVPAFREISGATHKNILVNGVSGSIYNHNRLLSSCEGVFSGKTGYTVASGRTLVTAAERNGATLVCVTLNAPDDWNDHRKLYTAGFSKAVITEFKSDDHLFEIPAVGGEGSATVSVKPEKDMRIITTDEASFHVRYSYPVFVYAPISRGERVGYLRLSGNGIEYSVALISVSDVAVQEHQYGALWRLNTMWRALINKEKE